MYKNTRTSVRQKNAFYCARVLFLASARRGRAPRREFYFLPVLAKILRFCGKIAKKPGFLKL
jgi:hypothetical protein